MVQLWLWLHQRTAQLGSIGLYFIRHISISFLHGRCTKKSAGQVMVIVLFSGIVNLVITGYFIISFLSATSGLSMDNVPGFGSYGISFGLWIAAISAIVITGGAWLFRSTSDNIRTSFDSLKGDLQKTLSKTGKSVENKDDSK